MSVFGGGGAWLNFGDGEKIAYRVDPDGKAAEFVFFGPVELSVGMSDSLVRRCQALFVEARAEMERRQQTRPEDRAPRSRVVQRGT